MGEIDLGARRVNGGGFFEHRAQFGAPGEIGIDDDAQRVLVEQVGLVDVGREQAARIGFGQSVHHLLIEPNQDQHLLQGVAAELLRPRLVLGQQGHIGGGEALDQGVGERRLVVEMMEERTLGDTGLGDQLVDRGRRVTLVEDHRLGGIEDLVAGRGAVAGHRLYLQFVI